MKTKEKCIHESSIRCNDCGKVVICDDCDEQEDYHSVRDEIWCEKCFYSRGGRISDTGESTFEKETEEEKQVREKEEREKIYRKYPVEIRHEARHLILGNGFAYNIEAVEKGRDVWDFGGVKTEHVSVEELKEDIDECEKWTQEEIEEYKENAKNNHIDYMRKIEL